MLQLFKIVLYSEGARCLYTQLMAPDVFLFPSENIYTLLILLVTLKSVLMKRAKSRWTWNRSRFSYSLLRESGVKIFIVNFFYELKLYLLVSSQCPSARGSVLTSCHAPFAACHLRRCVPQTVPLVMMARETQDELDSFLISSFSV